MATDRSEKRSLWIWKDDRMIKETITCIPGLYKLFSEIVVNAARNPNLTSVKVRIDVATNLISVRIDGEQDDVYVPEFRNNNYDDSANTFLSEPAAGKQVFTGKKKSEITKCHCGDEYWTIVSFEPDLKNIGVECLEDDTVALLKRRVVDLAGCLGTGVKVELDGKRVPPKTFQDYVKLYRPTSMRIFDKLNNGWKVCICLTDRLFEQVSCVNNIATIKGGSHVDYITSQITSYLTSTLDCEPNDIKRHLWVFVNAFIHNPTFNSQTKEELVAKLGVVYKLFPSADFNQNEKLKKEKLSIPKLKDAYLAATAYSRDCTLILTQGDSAKALAMSVSGLSVVDKDFYGVYPLTGKLLNVREASPDKNAEFQNIMKILGLRHGEIYENVEKLRYGHVMIMADQDYDGSRTKGLLINFFHLFWPSLLKVPNFLRVFITPISKASTKNTKKVKLFYTTTEYEAWEKMLGDKATKYKITYFKGLGSILKAEGKVCFGDLDRHIKDFFWVDNEDGDAIELAFSDKKIEERKDWLRAVKPCTILDLEEKRIRYRDFIHLNFRQYLVADLQRSIPSMVDGLKSDQRNILFCAFKWPFIEDINVAMLGDYVSVHSHYHHDGASLVGTIVGMASKYVGSNNINLLQPKGGSFGTRYTGGKDHGSGTHLFTQLSPITRYIFHENDEHLLKYLKDGGRSIEPTWFIPIIPMVLVNGSEGSGPGWSTFIPNYDPQDIIRNLIRLLDRKTLEPMRPWYKGFNGTIQKTSSKDTQYTTTGIYKVIKEENALRITELPVRRWTQDYEEFLEAASEDGKDETPFIKAYTAHCVNDTVDFEIFMTQEQRNTAEQEGILKKFELTTTLSTTNMHLFDANGVIKKYDTPEQILQEFFHLRIKFYEERKTAQLCKLEETLSLLENKVKEYIDDKKIHELQQEIKAKKDEYDLLKVTSPEDLWRRDLTTLVDQLKELEDETDDMIRNWKIIYEEDIDSDEEEPQIAEEAPKKAPAKRFTRKGEQEDT